MRNELKNGIILSITVILIILVVLLITTIVLLLINLKKIADTQKQLPQSKLNTKNL